MVFKVMASPKFKPYFNQTLLTILINVPIISFGLVMGWMSPNALLLKSSESPSSQPLSDHVISWMASVTFLSAFPAVFLFGYLADYCGRKPALLWTSTSFAICWILKLWSSEPWAFITARAIAGFGSSGSFIVIPLYVKEISEDAIRGALGSVMIFGQNLGYLLMYILGDYAEYRTVLWSCLAVSLCHIAVFCFAPESPAYLALKSQRNEACAALSWLRDKPTDDKILQEELDLLSKEAVHERTTLSPLKFLLAESTKLKIFIMVQIVVLAPELCGVFTLLMYAGIIFDKAGESYKLSITSNQQTMILGAVQLIGSILALCLVEKIGRKRLLAGTGFAVAGCTLAVGVWFLLSSFGFKPPGWIPLVAMCLGMLTDSAGLQPVPFVFMSEVFSIKLRGVVATVTMGLCCLVNFCELKIFHPISNVMGIHSVFFIYTAVTFLFAIYVMLCVPETMGKTVEEIYEELSPSANDAKNIKHNRQLTSQEESVCSHSVYIVKDFDSNCTEQNKTDCFDDKIKFETSDKSTNNNILNQSDIDIHVRI